MEFSDSPSLPRIIDVAAPSAFRTDSLRSASAWTWANASPVLQLVAVSPTTYWLPTRSSEPLMKALPSARRHTSRARSGPRCAPGARPMSVSSRAARRSATMFRKGDCSRPVASPCLSVSSKMASPVELEKPASTIESRSVSASTCRVRRSCHAMTNPVATAAMTSSAVAVRHRRGAVPALGAGARRPQPHPLAMGPPVSAPTSVGRAPSRAPRPRGRCAGTSPRRRPWARRSRSDRRVPRSRSTREGPREAGAPRRAPANRAWDRTS